MFTEPLPPLCEIVDDYGLARRGEWLAPDGFDFDRWHFERGCAALAERHDLDPDDAFALYTLVKLYDQMSLLLIDAADADEPLEDALAAAGEGATESPRSTGSSIWWVSSGPGLPTRCWLSCCWPRRSAPAATGRPRWACSPRCWSRRCRARRGWRFAGCARWRWSGSATSTRPNASCWRPSRWIRTGRCHCSTWPASPPIAATSSAGWRCCAAPAPGRTTRWWSYWSGTGPSRAATSAATSCAGAGPAASTRNAISGASSCRWPSGWAGCTRRPASTRC